MGARYLSAVALSMLFYDRLIHFEEEVTDIWSNLRERTWLKLLFLFGRCTADAYIIYSTAVMGGFSLQMNQKDCQTFIIIAVLLVKVSAIGTEGIVIYRLRFLWNNSRYVTYVIGVMFTLMVAAVSVSTIFEVMTLPDFTYVTDFLVSRQCLFIFPGQALVPSMVVEASVFMVWDVFIILVFTTNTIAIPHRCSYDVFNRFKRDGGRYFIYLFAIRSLYFFMSIFGKASRFSLLPVVWALCAIINARLFHRMGRDLERMLETLP